MTTKWNKYSYLNTDNDCLIEVTHLEGTEEKILHTPLNATPYVLLSVEDATIQPTTTEEDKMETTMQEVGLDILNARIKQLEEAHAQAIQRSYTESAERNRMRNEMQEFTLEQLDEDSLTEGQAEEIASICGFELTKEFEVEVTVIYSATVNARNEEQAMNAIYDIDFDTVDYNTDSVSYMSSTVDRVDI